MVNIEAVIVAAFRAGGVAGGRVHVDLPPNVAYPCGRVTRIGGGLSANPQWLDRALVQIDFWGSAGPNATDEAFDCTAAAVAVLGALRGSVNGGVVTHIGIDSIGNVFDTTFQPSRARRIITATVVTHPTP